MSGILNKKERLLDFVLTVNGRKQIQNNDIRFKYASISDRSVLYTKDYEKSILNKNEISNSDVTNLFFEVPTKVNDEINPELDLKEFVSYDDQFYNINNLITQEFTDAELFLKGKFSLSENILNLKSLTTKSEFNDKQTISFFDNGYLNNDLDLKNNVSNYFSIKDVSINKINLPTIFEDKKFKDKTNFLELIPQNSFKQKLYSEESFLSEGLSDFYNVDNKLFKNYSFYSNSFLNSNVSNESQKLINILKDIENRPDALKRVYEIENNKDDCYYLFELFENSDDQLKKMFIIKTGEFYDSQIGNLKKVYQAGHIINTRDKVNASLNDLFIFKEAFTGKILENNKKIILPAYYSFITVFTIVIE